MNIRAAYVLWIVGFDFDNCYHQKPPEVWPPGGTLLEFCLTTGGGAVCPWSSPLLSWVLTGAGSGEGMGSFNGALSLEGAESLEEAWSLAGERSGAGDGGIVSVESGTGTFSGEAGAGFGSCCLVSLAFGSEVCTLSCSGLGFTPPETTLETSFACSSLLVASESLADCFSSIFGFFSWAEDGLQAEN